MAKPYDKRITDALATLRAACLTPDPLTTYYAVLEWLQRNTQHEAAVSADISLNTHFSFQKADRDRYRAYLLIRRTIGGVSGAVLATEKATMLGKSSAAFPGLVQAALTGQLTRRPLGGLTILEPSVMNAPGYGPASEQLLRAASLRAGRILARVIGTWNEATSRTRYTKWFGADEDDDHRPKVLANFRTMLTVLQSHGIVLEYKQGTGYGSTPKARNTTAAARIAVEDKFFSGALEVANLGPQHDGTAYDAAVIQFSQVSNQLDTAKEHEAQHKAGAAAEVLRLKAELDRLAGQWGDGNAAPSYSGMIIHELSHNVTFASDFVFRGRATYGANLALRLARHDPANAIDNADNIRLYCEEAATGL